MSRYPGAVWLPIPESRAQAHISPTQVILHSVAAPWSIQRIGQYWQEAGVNVESHFGVGYDGSIGQYVDTNVRADANVSANNTAISCESAANTGNTDPWREAQIVTFVQLMTWAHKTHGIPARICRSAADPGYGIHRMFPTWSFGGTYCPGDARALQFRNVVFPRFLRAIAPVRTYTVKQGETLTRIGVITGLSWVKIADLNGIKSPYVIYPGQVLKLP